jgi:hypothetical protein
VELTKRQTKRLKKYHLVVQRLARDLKDKQKKAGGQVAREGEEADDVLNEDGDWDDKTEEGLSHKQMRYEKRRAMVTKLKEAK